MVLDFSLIDHAFFKKYEFETNIKNVFILKVDDNFENNIKILEGQYGKWFNEQQALNEPKLIDEDKLVLKELFAFLRVLK